MRITLGVGALVTIAWVMPAHAQQLDSRWAPWLGCWQLAGERVRVCVAPSADAAGVTLSTHVENAAEGRQAAAPVLEQTLVADGARHSIAEGECRGWQQAEWSRTGERLFARAELTCAGESVRRVSGLSTIAGGGTWIDIQGIEIAGRENIRVRRYRRASDRAGQAAVVAGLTARAPRLGATRFTLDDVKEASARVSPRVMEAALVETSAGFDLSSRVLVDLDAAGVPDNVIDTMVALSYPRHFVVDRPGGGALAAFPDPYFGSTGFSAWPSPYYSDYWSGYDVYSPYFYSPFGYAYWGSYGGYFPYGSYVSGPGFMNIDVSDRTDGGGRAVNGVGYTRIRTRAEVEAQANGGRRTDSTGSTDTSSTSGGPTSSSSGSSGVSSSGFSSGSSSTDTGRTAQPR
jgi:hypothetical protein